MLPASRANPNKIAAKLCFLVFMNSYASTLRFYVDLATTHWSTNLFYEAASSFPKMITLLLRTEIIIQKLY